jgi:hypothetical protein
MRYHRRNLVETAFSILKRKFGESLKARNYRSQIKELKIKLILYNISKIILTILIWTRTKEFYRADYLIEVPKEHAEIHFTKSS